MYAILFWLREKWKKEVAYAIGKGKNVIRILEEGTNYKPALSGDAEYISIKSENQTEAFIKLAYILNSLLK